MSVPIDIAGRPNEDETAAIIAAVDQLLSDERSWEAGPPLRAAQSDWVQSARAQRPGPAPGGRRAPAG